MTKETWETWDGMLPSDDEIKAWMREHFQTRIPFAVAAKERFPGIEITHLVRLAAEVLITGRTP